MYNSPIELLVTDIQNQILQQQDENIYQAVLHYVPNVDKEELLRALKYDRDQYEKGYMDGKADAMASIVRCKDCRSGSRNTPDGFHWPDGFAWCTRCKIMMNSCDFCSYGERKDNDG